jgi:polyisoprenoid-binding protein YceI
MQRTLTVILCLTVLTHLGTAASLPVDTEHSQLAVRVFKSGIFSGLAHDHEILAPVGSGNIDTDAPAVQIRFRVEEMKVLDPKASPDDRAQIQRTMLSEKVLDPARFPEIVFRSQSVTPQGENKFLVTGELTLHGATRTLEIPVSRTGNRYTGTVQVKQTDFGITPIKLFGGAVKVKDAVEISFEIASR